MIGSFGAACGGCSFRADNGGAHGRRYLVEGIVAANLLPPHRCSGETLDLGPLDRTMATFGHVLPLGGIVLEQVLAGGVLPWSGVTSTMSATMSPSSMVHGVL